MSLIIYNTGYVFSRSAQVPQMAIFVPYCLRKAPMGKDNKGCMYVCMYSSQLEKLTFFLYIKLLQFSVGHQGFHG